MAANARGGYLKGQAAGLLSLLNQEGEGRDAGTDGARSQGLFVPDAFFFSSQALRTDRL